MGGDNLFHKRRDRKTSDFARKKATRNHPSRQPQPRILIVCEDSKSSAYYLEELVRDLGLKAITIEGKRCGSAPSSVLEFAHEQYKKSVQDRSSYDGVYCVFDRDQHDSFDETVNQINQLKQEKKPFFAITTTPCFEFWLLLHFQYTSASFNTKGHKSPCDCAKNALTTAEKLPNYGKNKRQTYADTKANLATAITSAKRLFAENQLTGSKDPQTNMHELVEYLQSIQR